MIAVRSHVAVDVPAPAAASASGPPLGLAALVRAARQARDNGAWDAAAMVGEVTARLEAVREVPRGDREQVAAELLALLDGGAFDDLQDQRAVSAHYAAVEAVLTLGYPWALNLRPEDLQRHHGAVPFGGLRRSAVRITYAVASAAAASTALWFYSQFDDAWRDLDEVLRVGALLVFSVLAFATGIGALTTAGTDEARVTNWVVRVSGFVAALALLFTLNVAAVIELRGEWADPILWWLPGICVALASAWLAVELGTRWPVARVLRWLRRAA